MLAHRRREQCEPSYCSHCYQGFPTLTELDRHRCPALPQKTKRVSNGERVLIDRMMTQGIKAIVLDVFLEESASEPVSQRPFEEYLLEAVFVK